MTPPASRPLEAARHLPVLDLAAQPLRLQALAPALAQALLRDPTPLSAAQGLTQAPAQALAQGLARDQIRPSAAQALTPTPAEALAQALTAPFAARALAPRRRGGRGVPWGAAWLLSELAPACRPSSSVQQYSRGKQGQAREMHGAHTAQSGSRSKQTGWPTASHGLPYQALGLCPWRRGLHLQMPSRVELRTSPQLHMTLSPTGHEPGARTACSMERRRGRMASNDGRAAGSVALRRCTRCSQLFPIPIPLVPAF